LKDYSIGPPQKERLLARGAFDNRLNISFEILARGAFDKQVRYFF
jgi:hypothetical protein